MHVRLLGPVEAGPVAEPVRIPATKQRSLLAVLALHRGTVVGLDTMTDALWGECPPASAPKLLKTYVSQLRRLLPEPGALVTRAPGYALDVPPDAVDVARFARLVDAGSHARSLRAPHDAAHLLQEALGLWRGDPLLDVGPAALFEREAMRLWELRLRALEDWYAVRLELGEAAEVVDRLQSLATEHPLREGLHESLVLALYLCGRQAEALEAYDAIRILLRDALGIEPSAGLRDLHVRLLRQEIDVPAASTLRLHRLPTPMTPTIGREQERAQLQALLADRRNRLITLIGPGGSGKTRLATVAAERAAASYSGGVVLVPLDAVRDPLVALATIAAAVHVPDIGGDTLTNMARELSRRELLVVLDNLEQLVAVGPSLATLLAQAPGLTLLVTSRVVLDVAGERAFPVPPLALSDTADGPLAAPSPAVALFADRAKAALSSFALSQDNLADVSELCRRLDGLPLGIELVAAQSRLLSPAQMVQRLHSGLDASGAGQRDRPARHQSLRSVLDGSHGLLTAAGRQLFAALSVFAGGFDLAAAETVCGASLRSLAELVDHSLVQVVELPERRFRLLETVREYAAERRAQHSTSDGGGGPEQGASDDLRRRHAAYYLDLARSANFDAGRLTAEGQRVDVVVPEQDNIRAALAWCLSSGCIALALEIATALEFFWVSQNPREGVRWLSALLEHPGAEAVDEGVLAHALRAYGTNADIAGDDHSAEELYQRSLAIFERTGDERGRAVLLHRLGTLAMRREELTAARDLVVSSHQLMERQQDAFVRVWGQAQSTGTLGAISRAAGDPVAAYDLLARSGALAREAGVRWWEAQVDAELAAVSLAAGRTEQADLHAREALLLAGDPFVRVFAVGVLAGVAAEHGQDRRAGQLWAVVEHDDAVGPLGGWRRFRGACASHVSAAAGPAFERGLAEGRVLSLDEAVVRALEVPTER